MTLAAILHLGNTTFVAMDDSEAADVKTVGTLRKGRTDISVDFMSIYKINV